MSPSPACPGAAKKQALEKANNVALKGNTVLFGRLLAVVFATGPRTVLSRTKDLFPNRGPTPKLKRGIDKKKVGQGRAHQRETHMPQKGWRCL